MDEAHLAAVPLFAGLSKKERRRIAGCADEVDIREGKRLVVEGDFAYEFFVIEEGTAEVSQHGQKVAELGPGDFLGEMGVVERKLRNADVVASTPMRVIVIGEQDLRQLNRELPKVAETIKAAIETRAHAVTESLSAG